MSFFSFIVLIFHITPSADTCHKLCLNGGKRHGEEMSRAHVWPELVVLRFLRKTKMQISIIENDSSLS